MEAFQAHRSLSEVREMKRNASTRRHVTSLRASLLEAEDRLEAASRARAEEMRELRAMRAACDPTLSETIEEREAVLAEAEADVDRADRERDALVLQLAAIEHVEDELLEAERREREKRAGLAARQKEALHAARDRAFTAAKRRVLTAAADEKRAQEEYRRREAAADACKREARKRVRDKVRRARELEERLQGDAGELHRRRAEGVLGLKRSIDSERAALAAAREAAEADRRNTERERERERQQLLAVGKNPEGVFGAREEEAAIRRGRRRLAKRIERAEMAILDRVVEEHHRHERAERARLHAERARKEHARSLGRAYAEERAERYLRARLAREPAQHEQHPSRFTHLRPSGFGRGQASPEVVAHERRLLERQGARLAETSPPGDASDVGDSSVGGGSAASAAAGRGPRSPPAQSALQRRRIAESQERHARRLAEGSPKTVCGRRYDKASKFLASPARLEFADFEVGGEMRLRLTLTNVSFTFNTFRVLPMPLEVANFFEVVCRPAGRMSAGVAASLEVVFRPQQPGDIDTELRFMAETGPFSVPVVCRAKRVHVSVASPVLGLGDVTLGDEARQEVVLRNAGALDADVTVTPEWQPDDAAGGAALPLLGQELAAACCSWPPGSLTVPARGEARLPVSFRPTSHGRLRLALRLKYAPAAGAAAPGAGETVVAVRARAHRPPVYAEAAEVDLQCCSVGHLYRVEAWLANRSTQACKIRASVAGPAAVRQCVALSPAVGFVQANGGRFAVAVRFEPTRELLKSSAAAAGAVDIPLRVAVASQTLPVRVTVRARPVDATVVAEEASLDFGDCHVTQAAELHLRLTNPAPFVQRLAFCNLPPHTEVRTDDGFVVLPPGATRAVAVVFRPPSATSFRFCVVARAESGGEVRVRCTGRGTEPPVRFSHAAVRFAPVPRGHSGEAAVLVVNPSATERRAVAFRVPAGSHLEVSPPRVELAAGESARVELRFSPPPDGDGPARHATHTVAAVAEGCEGSPPVALEVRTVAVPSALAADPPSVDFGQVAIGASRVLSVNVRNSGDTDSDLSVVPFGLHSPYKMLNWVAPAAPGQARRVVLEFSPAVERLHLARLVFRSEATGTALEVPLSGRGVAPRLELSGLDGVEATERGERDPARAPVLDLGDVLAGGEAERRLVVTNRSDFPFLFEAERAGAGAGLAAASVYASPAAAQLEPGEDREVAVRFAAPPGRSSAEQLYRVGGHLVRVRARGWEASAFVDVPGAPADAASSDPVALAARAAAGDAAPAAKQLYRVGGPPLEVGGAHGAEVRVGATPGAPAAGSWTASASEPCFVCEPSSGALVAPATVVRLHFDAERHRAREPDEVIAAVTRVTQASGEVTFTLKSDGGERSVVVRVHAG